MDRHVGVSSRAPDHLTGGLFEGQVELDVDIVPLCTPSEISTTDLRPGSVPAPSTTARSAPKVPSAAYTLTQPVRRGARR